MKWFSWVKGGDDSTNIVETSDEDGIRYAMEELADGEFPYRALNGTVVNSLDDSIYTILEALISPSFHEGGCNGSYEEIEARDNKMVIKDLI